MADIAAAAPAGSLEALTAAFNDQLAILQQAAALRSPDMTAHAAELGELEVQAVSHPRICVWRARTQLATGILMLLTLPSVEDRLMRRMQATVQALEHCIQHIQAAVTRERLQLPKVETIACRCT